MECPKCRFDNREEARFCSESGHKLEFICPKCGTGNRLGANFSDKCGHDFVKPAERSPIDYSRPPSYTPKHLADKILTKRSAIEGERKLVTLLFAHVANYTWNFTLLKASG